MARRTGPRAAAGKAVVALIGACGTAVGQTPPPAGMPPLVLPAVAQEGAQPQPAPAAPIQPGPAAGQPQVLPQPKAGPFPDDMIRMNRLATPLGATPQPTDADLAEARQYVDGVVDPKLTLDLIEGRSRLVLLKTTPTQTQIADPGLAQFTLLNPRQLTILGRRPGTTVLNLWFRDPADATKEKVISYLVRVLPDPELKARLEATYQELEREINRAFPKSRVKLRLVGDRVMASGQAHDLIDAQQILQILRANAPGQGGAGTGQSPILQTSNQPPILNLAPTAPNPNDPTAVTGGPGLANYLSQLAGSQVINNLKIPGEQQVMLRVVVAEVNRAAARSIGLNFSVINNRGVLVFSQALGGLTAGGGAGGGGFLGGQAAGNAVAGVGGATIATNLDNGRVPLALNALRTLNYARSLAEPTLTTLNGQPANFLAGGQFPVPVLGGVGIGGGLGGGVGNGLQGVQFVPFGVQLSFTPVITDRDRIRLSLNATVSTRDNQGGAQIGGAGVPGLTARTFNTTVELREGQTLAVAGLIQTNLGADSQRIPFIGDVPLLGRIGAVDRVSAGEQELVVLVTPELVHPLEPNELGHLPGADIFEPGDVEFYLHGRLESRRSYDYRSPVMTDIHRMLKYRKCEQQYIIGPSGHAEQLLLNSAASK